MNGVESVVGKQGVHISFGQSGVQASPGALATSRQQVADALGSTGFVYVVGQLRQNFQTYLSRQPFEFDVSDLKPGTLRELIAWVAAELTQDPPRAEETQANVQSERTVKLLA